MPPEPSTTPPASTHATCEPSAAEQHAEVLLRAVNAENITYSHFAVMMAVRRREHLGETPTLAGISIAVGYSYHAVRNITERTHYFERIDSTPIGLRLTPDGLEKLERVSRRIARYAAEVPAASPQ